MEYIETRKFPASISGAVSNLIPRHARSVTMLHHEETGECSLTAHRSEIGYARRAIRVARANTKPAI